MANAEAILKFQQRCAAEYSINIGLPEDYQYPNGNPIRTVPPIQTRRHGLMIVGAYPSARFESRLSSTSSHRRLIPIADNLQPFGDEVYFDGVRVRRLESGAGLIRYLLGPLGMRADECWITDLVKVFLYKPEHADSCANVVPGFKATILRPHFLELGKKSLKWIKAEYDICEPKLVVTLGEEVARIISGSTLPADKLLVPTPARPATFRGCVTYHCPHPDACRRSTRWRNRMEEIVPAIRDRLVGTA